MQEVQGVSSSCRFLPWCHARCLVFGGVVEERRNAGLGLAATDAAWTDGIVAI